MEKPSDAIVAIVCGGASAVAAVSRQSARSVADALRDSFPWTLILELDGDSKVAKAICGSCPCRRCGGKLKVIASIEDPPVIERILAHLGGAGELADPANPSRAPPQGDLLI